MAPNQSATKVAWLLDTFDPDRGRDLCFGTVDTWLAWMLSRAAARLHVTDRSNAAVTGLLRADASDWDDHVLDALNIPEAHAARARRLARASSARRRRCPAQPPIAGLVGDQQGSLIGQACVRPGQAKVTFGTGGMLDVCLGGERPAAEGRGPHGTFPIVAWTRGGELTWGVEAIMLTAGTNVAWLVEDLGSSSPRRPRRDGVAAACDDTGDVVFVPALLGLGTPALGLRRPEHVRSA